MYDVKIFGLIEMIVGIFLWGIIAITSKALLPVLALLIVVSGLFTWLKKSVGRYLNLICFTFLIIIFIFQTVIILIAIIYPASLSKIVPKEQLVSFRHLPIPLLIIAISSYVIYFFTRPKVKRQFMKEPTERNP